jgi:hypothetical protein
MDFAEKFAKMASKDAAFEQILMQKPPKDNGYQRVLIHYSR